MIRIQSVPFSGEPLSGVQIMGILETRALDFRNLIILSVNEGVLPAVSPGSSYIPFSLREAFGLPSVNYQESIYAYHFYRLLQRAENVTFTYNSNSEGLKSGEMSRFLIQMKYESVVKPDFIDLNFEIKSQGTICEIINRTDEHQLQLTSQFLDKSNRRLLSPSAINTWLNCRMKFYYRYINNLKEPDKISADIDPAMLGSILHDIMSRLYQDLKGQLITSGVLDSIIRDNDLLASVTSDSIYMKYNRVGLGFIGGNELIVRDVLMKYISRILNADKTIAPFTILNLEDSFSILLSVPVNGSQIEILAGGKADRIDVTGNITRIVDYKTGAVADSIKSVDDLFIEDRKKDVDGWLQTLLYCEAYLATNSRGIVFPSVYKIKKLGGEHLDDKLYLKSDSKTGIPINDYNIIRNEFVNGLRAIVSTIFSIGEPFSMTTDIRGKCSFCPYSSLCLR